MNTIWLKVALLFFILNLVYSKRCMFMCNIMEIQKCEKFAQSQGYKSYHITHQCDGTAECCGSQVCNRPTLKNKPILMLAVKEKIDKKVLDLVRSYPSNSRVLYDDGSYKSLTKPWYKSPLMKKWSQLKIEKVFFRMYLKGVKKVEMVFKGTGSNTENWFSKARLIASYPWNIKTLQGTKYNYFQFYGDVRTRVARMFFINIRYASCPHDFGVLCVFDIPDVCNFAGGHKTRHFPIFQYVLNPGAPNGPANWRFAQPADEMRISVVLKA